MRIDYVRFYGGLGVGMEEIGLGYSEVLQASVAGLAILGFVLLGFAVVAGGVLLLLCLIAIVFAFSNRYEPKLVRDLIRRAPTAAVIWRLVAVIALLLLVTIGAILGNMADDRAKLVRAGEQIEPINVRDVLTEIPVVGDGFADTGEWLTARVGIAETLLSAPVLNVKAHRAKIDRTTDDTTTHSCVMYLGSSDGAATFFDHTDGQVIRVPAGNASISTPSEGC